MFTLFVSVVLKGPKSKVKKKRYVHRLVGVNNQQFFAFAQIIVCTFLLIRSTQMTTENITVSN